MPRPGRMARTGLPRIGSCALWLLVGFSQCQGSRETTSVLIASLCLHCCHAVDVAGLASTVATALAGQGSGSRAIQVVWFSCLALGGPGLGRASHRSTSWGFPTPYRSLSLCPLFCKSSFYENLLGYVILSSTSGFFWDIAGHDF